MILCIMEMGGAMTFHSSFLLSVRLYMEFYENKDKAILCPLCKKLLIRVDKRDNRENYKRCKNCNKLIYYIPLTGKTRVTRVPERPSSSCKIFY